MGGKKTKGRQKIEMKKIENEEDRLITFSKRRSGIYKKSSELATLCGAEVAFVAFSPSGKPFSFGHPNIESVSNRFLDQNPPQADSIHDDNLESMRQARIQELNEENNELDVQLELEKERGKALEEELKEGNEKGWWETPTKNLTYEGLKEMEKSWMTLQKGLLNSFEKKTGTAAFSANFAFPPTICGQASTGEGSFSKFSYPPAFHSRGSMEGGSSSHASASPPMIYPQVTFGEGSSSAYPPPDHPYESSSSNAPSLLSGNYGQGRNPFGADASRRAFQPYGGFEPKSF